MESFIHVGYLDISGLTSELMEKKKWELSEFRLAKVRRCLMLDKRKQSFGAGLLLENMLSKMFIYDRDFALTANGKPYLPNSDIYFNLSHSGAKVVCAISNLPVGIDLQEVDEFSDNVYNYAFNPNEQAYIGDNAERMYQLWAIKESYIKLKDLTLSAMKRMDAFDIIDGDIIMRDQNINFFTDRISWYRYAVMCDMTNSLNDVDVGVTDYTYMVTAVCPPPNDEK